jgi:hypothetical protein
MVLKKIYKIIEFIQSKWLTPYINFNTKQQMSATTDFEKDYQRLEL